MTTPRKSNTPSNAFPPERDVSDDAGVKETPAAKALKRIGRCVNPACTFGCEAFAFAKRADGFRTCVCSHTEWSHAERIVVPS